MVTQTTVYTYDLALLDAIADMADDFAEVAKLPATERAERIKAFGQAQSDLAHKKLEAWEKSVNDARMKREGTQSKFKTGVTEAFTAMWSSKPEFARDILAMAKADASIRAVTVQVTVHREDKTEGEGDEAKTIEVISLGSPVTMLGTRVAPKAKASTSNGNGTGSGSSSEMTVDGTTYPSASAASKAVLNDERGANRLAIEAKLVKAGHKVT